MSRTTLSAALSGAVLLGAASLLPIAGPASAEPTSTPAVTDIVGVGSDTSQYALNYLADGATVDGVSVPGYNDGGRTSEFLRSFDALAAAGEPPLSATIVPKEGAPAITRPNGSTAGKNQLYGADNNPNINYARSSAGLSAGEVSANLWAVPFAVDGLRIAKSSSSSNAPASLTGAQILAIYKGEATTWDQVGGTGTAAIVPYIPQPGSGTRAFFLSELKALNGGASPTLGGNVQESQEHDASVLASNPNAIAPFSTGRAKSASGITLLPGTAGGGWGAQRALYNVVRQADMTAPWFGQIFGPSGFICSDSARPLVEAAGFEQLARATGGGVCGEATQSNTSNFKTNDAPVLQETTTALAASASGQRVTLTATVSPETSGTPTGTVTFKEGAVTVGTANLSGGVAVVSLTGVSPGTHTYTAVFSPANAALFKPSTSAGRSVSVARVASKTTVRMPLTFSKTQRVRAIVRVTRSGGPATGRIVVKKGPKTVARGALNRMGKVTIQLPRLPRGSYRLVFRYGGNATTLPSRAVKRVTVTR